ncbi:MAG TPA: transketolase C-terminal domain-containing protein [Rhodocyclaceae bacterium]|nr:transketolase C-terminal domain-containing protein [Rhodocyclaceae bacterium]
MRNAFADEVTKLVDQDSRVVMLSGDIGNKLFDNVKKVDERRFYNCGVAEANMMGVAAGMALCGLRPIVYTITPFTTTRCFEQIRVDACYHHVPVTIVGTGSGLSYAELGPTHHSLEDLAILRTLPGMSVLAPCDANELRACMRAALKQNGPVYIRIGKKGEAVIFKDVPDLVIGKATTVRSGNDVALLCAGTLMAEALGTADRMNANGISTEVVSMHSVKPLDTGYLDAAATRFKLIATIEEHGLIGGLGSAVAEWRARTHAPIRQIAFGTPDEFMHEVGSQEYARRKYGLTADDMAAVVIDALRA